MTALSGASGADDPFLSFFGTHSSSSSRMDHQQVLCLLEHRDRLRFRHGGEVIQELGERVPAFEVVEESLNRHPSTDEDRSPAEDLWIAVDDFVIAHS